MANAFSPGRVSCWHTSPQSFNPDWGKVYDLGITDWFLPLLGTTTGQMDAIRKVPAPDGKMMRAQLYFDGTHGATGNSLAVTAVQGIAALKPGVLEVDFEAGDDNFLGVAVRDFLKSFRLPDQPAHWRNAYPIAVNLAPLKGYVMPWNLLIPDANTYVRVQRYYGGECRPAEPTLCRDDIVGRGLPPERFSFMESAKARRLADGSIFCDLPVFSDRGERVRNLSGGAIFDANLLREAGLV